jgi:hypothetical protein
MGNEQSSQKSGPRFACCSADAKATKDHKGMSPEAQPDDITPQPSGDEAEAAQVCGSVCSCFIQHFSFLQFFGASDRDKRDCRFLNWKITQQR